MLRIQHFFLVLILLLSPLVFAERSFKECKEALARADTSEEALTWIPYEKFKDWKELLILSGGTRHRYSAELDGKKVHIKVPRRGADNGRTDYHKEAFNYMVLKEIGIPVTYLGVVKLQDGTVGVVSLYKEGYDVKENYVHPPFAADFQVAPSVISMVAEIGEKLQAAGVEHFWDLQLLVSETDVTLFDPEGLNQVFGPVGPQITGIIKALQSRVRGVPQGSPKL